MVNEWNGRGYESFPRWVPYLPLYRVQGQGLYKEEVLLAEGSSA